MIIKRLKASFGRLQGEELFLKEGLNIIEAPNEAGKSTWSHFIRAMLYGISTSERSRSGSIPDRLRFRPWGSLPMEGVMDIVWRGREITLTRPAVGGDRPMGGCIATYTGTGERIPELMGKNTGELLLGVGEAVFRRSAFITCAEIPIDKDAELEKKITALVTSGDEDCSYTDVDERLRRWQRKRRYRSDGGRLPEAEKRLREVRRALESIEAESSRLGDLRERLGTLEKQRELLELELRRHARDERLEARNRLEAAELEYSALKEKMALLEAETGGVGESDIKALEAENSRLALYEEKCDEAARELEKAEREYEALPKAPAGGAGGRGLAAAVCLAAALMAAALALFLRSWLPATPAALLAAAALYLLISALRSSARLRAEIRAARELAEYKLRSAGERREAALAEKKASAEALELLMRKLGAREGETPEAVSARLTAAKAALSGACAAAAAAASKIELLKGLCRGDADDVEGETRLSRAEAEAYLKQATAELEKTARELARGEGAYGGLGDPLLLSTEEKRLAEELVRLEKEYRALDLAIYAMRDANAKLQALFSPIISREAGRLLSRMTSGGYRGVFFDRDLRFSAARAGDVAARELEYLSDGTKNQLYLAVRLAISRLALPRPPEGEPCPIVLDDALDSFDDERTGRALELLEELAGERQIILFTCHSREKRMMEDRGKQ